MAYRWHPKYAEVDSEAPKAWSTCSRCGFVTNLSKMVWQFDFRGSSIPQNTRILVCGRQSCLDEMQPQNAPFILSPDPPPIFNAQPENYVVDETNWLSTQDGDIIDTESGENLITSNPNPASPAYPNANSIVEEASENAVTEDGEDEIVTEPGDGNPINYEPNP